ncbi:hypothetical protein RHMOL_Rhmol01G0098700 [Rhododendron molle]|uniref:Uncharacterized protein n=1 Tax=Rhododendron molle TaxID=49168 RepID=A0ACC0Q0D1_RHOML|nr:hypothetical protein RHMOL_Rhmol01G0098700 [Rhododendron molle]
MCGFLYIPQGYKGLQLEGGDEVENLEIPMYAYRGAQGFCWGWGCCIPPPTSTSPSLLQPATLLLYATSSNPFLYPSLPLHHRSSSLCPPCSNPSAALYRHSIQFRFRLPLSNPHYALPSSLLQVRAGLVGVL